MGWKERNRREGASQEQPGLFRQCHHHLSTHHVKGSGSTTLEPLNSLRNLGRSDDDTEIGGLLKLVSDRSEVAIELKVPSSFGIGSTPKDSFKMDGRS